jgi:hypothetical protein
MICFLRCHICQKVIIDQQDNVFRYICNLTKWDRPRKANLNQGSNATIFIKLFQVILAGQTSAGLALLSINLHTSYHFLFGKGLFSFCRFDVQWMHSVLHGDL